MSIPAEAIQAAAEVRLRQYETEYSADHLTWHDFEDEVRAVLEAAEQAWPHQPPKRDPASTTAASVTLGPRPQPYDRHEPVRPAPPFGFGRDVSL